MTLGPRCRSLLGRAALAVAILLPLCFNPLVATPFEPYKVAVFGAAALAMAAVRTACWLRHPPRGGRAPLGEATHPFRNPLLGPCLGYVAALLLATLVSVDPRLSLWGRRAAPHGLATSVAQVVFFLLAAEALTDAVQVARVGPAIVAGTVPVALYGVVQQVGLDPIPWRLSPVWRPFSTMGSSLFLGAYLAMALPFTLAGLARASAPADRLRYSAVLALQALTRAHAGAQRLDRGIGRDSPFPLLSVATRTVEEGASAGRCGCAGRRPGSAVDDAGRAGCSAGGVEPGARGGWLLPVGVAAGLDPGPAGDLGRNARHHAGALAPGLWSGHLCKPVPWPVPARLCKSPGAGGSAL